MKVCMIVFNSVSHDTRVLKEAKSVADIGHDVVVIGLQTNNSEKLHQRLNNFTIRRALYIKSKTLKGLVSSAFFKYFKFLLLCTAMTIGGLFFIQYADKVFTFLRTVITLDSLFVMGVTLFFLFGTYQIFKSFFRQFKKYKRDLTQHELKIFMHESFYKKESSLFNSLGSKRDLVKKNYFKLNLSVIRSFTDKIKNSLTYAFLSPRERAVFEILQSEAPDIIHAHDIYTLPLSALYKSKHGGVLVFDAHELYDQIGNAQSKLRKKNKITIKKHSSSVDHFITVNESIKSYYLTQYPHLVEAKVIKNSVIKKDWHHDDRLRLATGIAKNKKIVLYQGGFSEGRGIIKLLLSAQYFNDEWVLVFMGSGKLLRKMIETIHILSHNQPNIFEKIKIIDKVPLDELVYWTSGASIGVIPYENNCLNHWFCSPNKLWEYPYAKVPIIASPFPEISKIIDLYKIGWFLPDPLTPKGIANIINELTDDDLKEKKIGCTNFIKSDNWDSSEVELNKIYGMMV